MLKKRFSTYSSRALYIFLNEFFSSLVEFSRRPFRWLSSFSSPYSLYMAKHWCQHPSFYMHTVKFSLDAISLDRPTIGIFRDSSNFRIRGSRKRCLWLGEFCTKNVEAKRLSGKHTFPKGQLSWLRHCLLRQSRVRNLHRTIEYGWFDLKRYS